MAKFRVERVGTILAVLLLGVLANGLIQLRIPSFWIEVFGGVLLLVAVGFDQRATPGAGHPVGAGRRLLLHLDQR